MQELLEEARDEVLDLQRDLRRLEGSVQALEQKVTAMAEEVKELREFKRTVVLAFQSLVL